MPQIPHIPQVGQGGQFLRNPVHKHFVGPPPAPVTSTLYWGARIDGQFYSDNYSSGSTQDAPWAAADSHPNNWDLFETHAGKVVSLIHWGGSGSAISSFDTTAESRTRARGAFSFYSMGALSQDLTDLAANSDANGAITRVNTWATAVHGVGHPVLLRPWWEMNGNWGYNWQTAQGITTTTYKNAWIKLHALVNAICDEVSFCWCPNVTTGGITDPTGWFPGTAYVDWMGMDGYAHSATSNESPSQVFDATYTILQGLHPTAPIAIGETACSSTITSPTKAAWITDFLGTWIPAHPAVKAFSWFNEAGNPANPWIEQGPGTTLGGAAQSAFANGIASARFLTNGAASFPSHAKLPIPA